MRCFFNAQAASFVFHGIYALVFELKIAFLISKHFHCREFHFQLLFVTSTAVEMFCNKKSPSFFTLFIAGTNVGIKVK